MTSAVGFAVFAVIGVLALALDTLGRLRLAEHASLRDVGRWLRRHPYLRWTLLLSWGFVGWHFFVQ